jgi:N-acyl-D-amino-acid deacylase
VLRLAEQRRVSLDAPVLRYVELEPHLAHRAESDPRWQKVTVRHCLLHTGGWDRGRSFDPIAVPRRIAAALGMKPPVPPEDVVRYMLGRRLDFDPGTGVAYSNLGYLLLGRVIEAASGRRYEAFVRDEVLAPLGVTAPRLGRALPEHRMEGEARYYDAAGDAASCLYPPRAGERVPLPDGGENFEAFDAHGGWVASAPDLVRFAAAFDDPRRCPILSENGIRTMWARPAGRAGFHASGRPRAYYYGCGWAVRPVGADGRANTWHDGLIGGTSALLVRRHDGLSWAALFNTDRTPDGEVLSGVIDPLLHRAADEFVAGRGGPG